MAGTEVLTVEQMQAAEQVLFDRGISVDQLMQTAGEGAADWIWRMAGGRAATILCGPGNNGGDGYVIAETLRRRGLEVIVIAPIEPKTDAASNARARYKGEVRTSGKDVRGEVFVDCLFGSGLARPLSPEHTLLLRDLAQRHHLRVAVDLPSGIASDSGELLNEKLPAFQLTLAMGAWKYAHWRLPAREQMGELRLIEIGVPPTEGAAQLVIRPDLHEPKSNSHKYLRGLAVVVGGAMPGAALLASHSAMRAGAGYVKLLSDQSHPSAPAGLVIDDNALDDVLQDDRISAALIGPGLGRGDIAQDKLACLLESGIAAVLDADALHLVSPDILRQDGTYLATPHDGELEALCRSFSVVASGRQDRAAAIAKVSGMTVLAKGPDTIIAAPDGRIALAPPAPSWLSIAGTGDVLAGIAVSRMAAGSSPFDAACEAVWLHGEAARQAGPAFTADELALAVTGAMARALQG